MDLLYSNDKRGTYPPSWYAATANTTNALPASKPLRGETQADVCVIGAGFTGLSAALHLAQAGRNVVLLDAHRVGFGASGRNGGQLGSGQRMVQDGLEKLLGDDDAQNMWRLAEDAKDLVKHLVKKHNIECHLKPGVAHACFTKTETRHEHDYVAKLQDTYGYDQITSLDHDQMQEICPSPKYVGGSLDMGAGHLHPLNLALGEADDLREGAVGGAARGLPLPQGDHVEGAVGEGLGEGQQRIDPAARHRQPQEHRRAPSTGGGA